MTFASRLLLGVIKVYQVTVSPLLGQRCRFHPSCSCFAAEAVEQHGAVRGTFLAVRRLVRCHPWSEGGHDPVPPAADTPSSHLAKTSR